MYWPNVYPECINFTNCIRSEWFPRINMVILHRGKVVLGKKGNFMLQKSFINLLQISFQTNLVVYIASLDWAALLVLNDA